MTDTIQAPVAKAQMLIRKPVAQVFEALVDPAITSRFWFSKGSGRLEAGKQVRWDWEMYGASAVVDVKAIEENERILIEWGGPDNPSFVEWTFEPRDEGRTFVIVRNWGFSGDAETIVARALDSTGGFSFLLAGLKAFLEHGIELNLVVDHAPDALVAGWASEPGTTAQAWS
ncbi:MAG TPA: SRPBCC family protein [Thermoanaerobaculia bacterium]|nr:SRPBCC family protein [Thermoanaerobaculia bacterium]